MYFKFEDTNVNNLHFLTVSCSVQVGDIVWPYLNVDAAVDREVVTSHMLRIIKTPRVSMVSPAVNKSQYKNHFMFW